MSGKRLPKEVRSRVNRLAFARTRRPGLDNERAYRIEKAKILAEIVTALAAGKSIEEITRGMDVYLHPRHERLQKTLGEIRKLILEMP
ncbi:MAG: hypothetical protein E6R09_07320 [Rhodocyclaceae bacterium]|jgi:hypothetical protein|nr:MAG: hypothetical protein E6R09_07320 [Rhodocyclaceae bacterium]